MNDVQAQLAQEESNSNTESAEDQDVNQPVEHIEHEVTNYADVYEQPVNHQPVVEHPVEQVMDVNATPQVDNDDMMFPQVADQREIIEINEEDQI